MEAAADFGSFWINLRRGTNCTILVTINVNGPRLSRRLMAPSILTQINKHMTKTQVQQHLLTAQQLVPFKHHPDSLNAPHPHYRSVFTIEMIQALPPMICSGSFDGFVFFNKKHPNSPYIILKPHLQGLNVPGSGVNSGSLTAQEPLDLLAFYSGKSGWHGCTESTGALEHRISDGELFLSGKLS